MPETVFEMYHGTAHPATVFQYKYLGNGNEQEGPGFYFTNDPQDARKYAWPNGAVLTVVLTFRKIITNKAKPNIAELKKMVISSTSWKEEEWRSWNDIKALAFDTWLKNADIDTQHDAFLSVWYDFYRYNPAEYCQNMVKLGYDGVLIEQGYRNTKGDAPVHIVAFDPKKIRVIGSVQYKPESSERKKKVVKRVRKV